MEQLAQDTKTEGSTKSKHKLKSFSVKDHQIGFLFSFFRDRDGPKQNQLSFYALPSTMNTKVQTQMKKVLVFDIAWLLLILAEHHLSFLWLFFIHF